MAREQPCQVHVGRDLDAFACKDLLGGKDGGHSKTGKTTEGQYGDVRFMQIVAVCVEKRCKILGLDEPIKIDATVREKPVERMTMEEIESKIAGILNKSTNKALIGRPRAAESLN